MSTAIWTAVAIILSLSTLVAHEAGHAFALRKYGIRITEAGIGLPIWPSISLPPRGRRDFSLRLSPLLVAAWVRTADKDEDKISSLSYWDYSWFNGAGPIVNLILACALGGMSSLLSSDWVIAVIAFGAGALLFALRRTASAVLPVLMLPVIPGAVYIQLKGLKGGGDGVGTFWQILHVHTPAYAFGAAAAISLTIGIFNILPIFPLDGGKVLMKLLSKWLGDRTRRVYQASGLVLVLFFLASTVFASFFNLR